VTLAVGHNAGKYYSVNVPLCDGAGVTFVHFSAQRERFLRDRGCIERLFRGCLGAVRGYKGVYMVYTGCVLCQKRLRLS
jgi:hypothetical protein